MELQDLPALTRARQRLIRLFNSRLSTDMEWSADYSVPDAKLEITFFAARAPLIVEVATFGARLTRPRSLAYETDGVMEELDFQFRDSQRDDVQLTILRPARIQHTKRLVVEFRPPAHELQMQVTIRVAGKRTPGDLRLTKEAHNHMGANHFKAAAAKLREYEDNYSRRNPSVAYWLAKCYIELNALDKAEEAMVPALAFGNFNVCVELYQSIQKVRRAQSIEVVRGLQSQGQDWDLGGQHGLLVLDKTQEFSLGFEGFYLKKCCELVEVRRAAAARMLREMQFLFSSTTEGLLHSRVRVLHASGDVEELPDEHFRIIDHESNNVFVATEAQKAGHWILPDLAKGDVIEWDYHLLCRERLIEDQPSLFVMTSVFHEFFPTLHASCQLTAPEDWPLHITTHNMPTDVSKETLRGRDVYSLEGGRFLPAKRTGFAFENYYLNPLVACGNDEQSWKEVAGAALRSNFGSLDTDNTPVDELPTPLTTIIDEVQEPFEALEQAFYWIRDNLKYASFFSGKRLIGESHRAEKIAEAGVGDCNDKSYLLHLVCRTLGIDNEFVLISTISGVVIEELPGDQFDHVFLRARRGDRWLYLDAANSSSVFGSAPTWCQGLRCVVLNDAGDVETIALDAPSTNRIEIQEVFSKRQDGWLCGSFDFKALGQNGRFADQRWKATSLSVEDQVQAGQDCLRAFLPAAIVADFEIHSHTSHSSLFHVSGNHLRCPLSTLEGSQNDVGTLSWEFPILPMEYWRTLQIDRLFVFEVPMEIDITVTLDEELFGVLADTSSSSNFETDFCSIRHSVDRDARSCSIHRNIKITRRFVEAPDIDRLPAALEQLEASLQLVLAVRQSS